MHDENRAPSSHVKKKSELVKNGYYVFAMPFPEVLKGYFLRYDPLQYCR